MFNWNHFIGYGRLRLLGGIGLKKFEKVQDSGARESYDTGMVRDTQEEKTRYDLISHLALKRLADHYANGAKKYKERNWEKGGPVSRFYASMFRHLMAWRNGEKDEDHLAALAWNAFCVMHFEETGQEPSLNDLPYYKEEMAKFLRKKKNP